MKEPRTSAHGLSMLLLLAACESSPASRRGVAQRNSGVKRASSAAGMARAPSALGTPARPPTPSSSPARATAPTVSENLSAWLAESQVSDTNFARGRLYSWTRAATAKQMRRDWALLDDNQLPAGPTPYVRWLQHVAARPGQSGRLAKLLLGHPDLNRRRYAWSRPWATRSGLSGRDYGDRLIEVQLKTDALVGRFDASEAPAFRFVDLDQRPVPLARALAQPQRIAAIYHRGSAQAGRYREYVLCNQTMVKWWSIGSASGERVRREDARRLRELAGAEVSLAMDVSEAWQESAPDQGAAPDNAGDPRVLYAASLAFDVPHYRPTRANLLAIAERLDFPEQEKPLTVFPTRGFRYDAVPELVKIRRVAPLIQFGV